MTKLSRESHTRNLYERIFQFLYNHVTFELHQGIKEGSSMDTVSECYLFNVSLTGFNPLFSFKNKEKTNQNTT